MVKGRMLMILMLACCYTLNSQTVTATVYNAVEEQTNSDPGHTASMFKLDLGNPYKHRIIAVSRDLYNKGFTFGTQVIIQGVGEFSGIWVVQDLMNKRFSNRIDLLVNKDIRLGKWFNVKIRKWEK